jgi:hypothetical protein
VGAEVTLMSVVTERPRAPVAARRVGYGVSVAVNALLLYAVNVWPGWDVLPFLTGDMHQVLGWVNASMAAGVVANLVYLVHDPRWLKALGDVVTTAIGLAALLRMWAVFPFDFGDSSFDWTTAAHVLLAVGAVGSVIGIVVSAVTFFRTVGRPDPVTR